MWFCYALHLIRILHLNAPARIWAQACRAHITTDDQSVSSQVAEHETRVNDLCEERDDLRCKVTLLTTNARRMDRDVKRLQGQYDKLCDGKRQGGDQVRTNIPSEFIFPIGYLNTFFIEQ